ncbi:lytic murein transglycosylase [Jidongwangia harbinensis]|uniref:lytic murein transglycosylase n=1 Tax=Jidongwangia harbinensis TaxID=2878561 RepID=UPI001CD97050|nr:lytic murein transglycosylase [Jidongwangia harbinensis]MCA2213764.1 lytic murein transglycosylase [Jidongwangia harbinensis]
MTVTSAAAAAPVARTDVMTMGRDSERRVTRILRHANPVRAVRTVGRSTSAWARRPTGRLVIPALIGVLLLGAAGTAGAYLVPEALPPAPAASTTPGFPPGQAAAPAQSASALPPPGVIGSAPAAPTAPAVTGARPADALAGWAQDVGTRVGIPVVAVQAYGYAELVAARTAPNCRLSWTTIAAIGKVESSHGSANGAVLGADGQVQPTIYGLPLDGRGGRQEIRDTDQGTVDGDPQYDRAVGPMQFIPSTWRESGVDADNNGISDPNDIDDAAVAAALYLCKGGRDVSKADAWWDAILTYNAVRPYAQKVFDAANEYGVRSRQ